MKAIQVEKVGKLEIVDIPVPAVTDPRDVLVKVTSASVCASDLGIFRGSNSLARYPAVIGHEYAGVVESAGGLAAAVKPGDLVAVDPVRSCGRCFSCLAGRQNVCLNLRVSGVHLPGGFSEYVVAPGDRCHRLDPGKIPPDLACLVEPYSIGVQVNRRAGVEKGDRVLVIGSGPAGLCVLADAKARGAVVVSADLIESRLRAAEEFGADRTVNAAREDLAVAVADFTGGAGMPVVIDSACTLESFPQSLELASPAGRVVVMGNLDQPSPVAQVSITKKELTVIGTRLNNRRFPEAIDGMERGVYSPGKLRTHSFHFTKIAEAFDLIMNHPELVRKVVLTFD
ncbi:MAG: zinc-binding alcohol dehydrogenase family protein [Planctomycetota bacterium]|jgi:L-gulonate 5-dehydrogenase|nr:zinc-binding alcohol dehydrogenase family protein [Planctomycetota bacterium]